MSSYNSTLVQPWVLYRFLKPRADKTASKLVLVVDANLFGDAVKDTVTIMEVMDYAKGEKRRFKTIPAVELVKLIENKSIEEYVPKV